MAQYGINHCNYLQYLQNKSIINPSFNHKPNQSDIIDKFLNLSSAKLLPQIYVKLIKTDCPLPPTSKWERDLSFNPHQIFLILIECPKCQLTTDTVQNKISPQNLLDCHNVLHVWLTWGRSEIWAENTVLKQRAEYLHNIFTSDIV